MLSGQGADFPNVSAGNTNELRAPLTGRYSLGGTPAEVASLTPNRELQVRDLAARWTNDVPQSVVLRVRLVTTTANFATQNEQVVVGCSVTGTASSNEQSCTDPGPGTLPAAVPVYMRVTVLNTFGSTAYTPEGVYWGVSVEPVPAP